MDAVIEKHFDQLNSEDKNVRYEAYQYLLKEVQAQVSWAYEVWKDLINDLEHNNNHRRAIASQLLCHLAISDPENRIITDFPKIFAVTYDEKFVTARHTLQTIWKIGLAGEAQKEMVLNSLAQRYKHCTDEKNSTLIRYDIIQGLRNLYNQVSDPAIKELALELIELEEDEKYQKKYAKVWKNV